MGERVPRRTWLAMGAALAGTGIMVSGSAGRDHGTSVLAGDLLALGTALAFATATVIVRRHREVRMSAATALAAVFAALVALPQAAPLAAAPRDLLLLALFGAGQLGLGLLLFTSGARLIPVAEASLIAVLESLLGPMWVWLALGERPGRPSLLGGAVVLAALIAHTVADLRQSRAGRGGGGAPDTSIHMPAPVART
jgi:drug/metabolite transporter (DMT)-like permease